MGAGWQRVVAWVNIASYYLVGIPIGVVLGYVWNMHVKVGYLHIYDMWSRMMESN